MGNRTRNVVLVALVILLVLFASLILRTHDLAGEYYELLIDNGVSIRDIYMGSVYIIVDQEEFLELAKLEGQAYCKGIYFYVHHDGLWYGLSVNILEGLQK